MIYAVNRHGFGSECTVLMTSERPGLMTALTGSVRVSGCGQGHGSVVLALHLYFEAHLNHQRAPRNSSVSLVSS